MKRNDYRQVCLLKDFLALNPQCGVLKNKLLIIPSVPHVRSPRMWGTFSAAGGVGSTTLTLHLARIAGSLGYRTLVIETDQRAPIREILGSSSPYWEEYRLGGAPIKSEALPQTHQYGFSLLTRRSAGEISEELFTEICTAAGNFYDLVLLDNPKFHNPKMKSLLIVENNLTSLIGLNALAVVIKPRIVVINKYSSKFKKKSAITGFVSDSEIFSVPRSQDLGLALKLGVLRKLSPHNERKLTNIVSEFLNS